MSSAVDRRFIHEITFKILMLRNELVGCCDNIGRFLFVRRWRGITFLTDRKTTTRETLFF